MRDLLKGTFQSSIGTVFTLLFGAIVIKIIAVVNGPEGVGLFSILRQLQQTGTVVALIGGQTAIIQGLAKFVGRQQQDFLSAAFYMMVGATLVTTLALIIGAPLLSHYIFSDQVVDGVRLVRWSAIAVVCGAAYAFFSSVLNGHRLLGRLTAMQTMGAIAGSCIAYPLALWFQEGNAASYIFILAVPFTISSLGLFLIAHRRGFLTALFKKISVSLRSYEAKYFVSFASTTLITTLTQAAVLLIVRAVIVRKYNLSGGGEFDVAWTLSMMYVMLVLNSFAGYYLPTLSKITDEKERGHLVESVIRLSLVVMIPLVTAVIVFKALYVRLFYSADFLASLDMIRWMLIGDYLKVTSWIFAISMLAYAQMRPFFLTETLWSLAFLGVSTLAIKYCDSLEVMGIIFLSSYICYLIFSFSYIRIKWRFYISRQSLLFWLSGLIYVMAVSGMTWHQTQVYWWSSVAWILSSVGLVVIFVKNDIKKFFLKSKT